MNNNFSTGYRIFLTAGKSKIWLHGGKGARMNVVAPGENDYSQDDDGYFGFNSPPSKGMLTILLNDLQKYHENNFSAMLERGFQTYCVVVIIVYDKDGRKAGIHYAVYDPSNSLVGIEGRYSEALALCDTMINEDIGRIKVEQSQYDSSVNSILTAYAAK